jgi:hypothetical protein
MSKFKDYNVTFSVNNICLYAHKTNYLRANIVTILSSFSDGIIFQNILCNIFRLPFLFTFYVITLGVITSVTLIIF